MVDQDYSGYVRKVDFTTLPTVTVDSAADFIIVLDATDGLLKKGLPPAGGGGGISDGDKGDITLSSSGTVWNIDAGVVTTTELGGDITTAGKALLDDANASAQRTTLGLVTIASTGSAADLSSGTVATARLGSGTADGTTFLRGDQTWATPAGGGGGIELFEARALVALRI